MAYERISGVYVINCAVTKKVYVGSSCNVKARLASHRSYLRRGVHQNKHLQRAWDKYGESSFVFELIQECTPDQVTATEQLWIDRYAAHDPEFGMNNSPTAETASGFAHSPESKAVISQKARDRGYTSALRDANELRRGKPAHNRGKEGRKWTDVERERASSARKGRSPWNLGVPHTEDEKRRISIGVAMNRTRYREDVAVEIAALRLSGLTYQAISSATGVSLAQCHRIANGLRTFEKARGVSK